MPVLVTVGRVGRAHGVRGEVSVEVRTDSPEVRFAVGTSLTTEPERAGPLTVQGTRWHAGRLLVVFAGVVDRNGAEALRGVRLLATVDPDQRPGDPEEFFDHQLIGLSVVTAHGVDVGVIAGVVHLPGQDVLAIRRQNGAEVLVPFVAEIVPEIDLPAQRIVIDPPRGLLDPAETEEAAP